MVLYRQIERFTPSPSHINGVNGACLAWKLFLPERSFLAPVPSELLLLYVGRRRVSSFGSEFDLLYLKMPRSLVSIPLIGVLLENPGG